MEWISDKEALVMKLLLDKPDLYGLELVAAADGAIKRGTVYVTLARMVEKGLITSRCDVEPPHRGLPRPRYQVTERGTKALAAIEELASIMESDS